MIRVVPIWSALWLVLAALPTAAGGEALRWDAVADLTNGRLQIDGQWLPQPIAKRRHAASPAKAST